MDHSKTLSKDEKRQQKEYWYHGRDWNMHTLEIHTETTEVCNEYHYRRSSDFPECGRRSVAREPSQTSCQHPELPCARNICSERHSDQQRRTGISTDSQRSGLQPTDVHPNDEVQSQQQDSRVTEQVSAPKDRPNSQTVREMHTVDTAEEASSNDEINRVKTKEREFDVKPALKSYNSTGLSNKQNSSDEVNEIRDRKSKMYDAEVNADFSSSLLRESDSNSKIPQGIDRQESKVSKKEYDHVEEVEKNFITSSKSSESNKGKLDNTNDNVQTSTYLRGNSIGVREKGKKCDSFKINESGKIHFSKKNVKTEHPDQKVVEKSVPESCSKHSSYSGAANTNLDDSGFCSDQPINAEEHSQGSHGHVKQKVKLFEKGHLVSKEDACRRHDIMVSNGKKKVKRLDRDLKQEELSRRNTVHVSYSKPVKRKIISALNKWDRPSDNSDLQNPSNFCQLKEKKDSGFDIPCVNLDAANTGSVKHPNSEEKLGLLSNSFRTNESLAETKHYNGLKSSPCRIKIDSPPLQLVIPPPFSKEAIVSNKLENAKIDYENLYPYDIDNRSQKECKDGGLFAQDSDYFLKKRQEELFDPTDRNAGKAKVPGVRNNTPTINESSKMYQLWKIADSYASDDEENCPEIGKFASNEVVYGNENISLQNNASSFRSSLTSESKPSMRSKSEIDEIGMQFTKGKFTDSYHGHDNSRKNYDRFYEDVHDSEMRSYNSRKTLERGKHRTNNIAETKDACGDIEIGKQSIALKKTLDSPPKDDMSEKTDGAAVNQIKNQLLMNAIKTSASDYRKLSTDANRDWDEYGLENTLNGFHKENEVKDPEEKKITVEHPKTGRINSSTKQLASQLAKALLEANKKVSRSGSNEYLNSVKERDENERGEKKPYLDVLKQMRMTIQDTKETQKYVTEYDRMFAELKAEMEVKFEERRARGSTKDKIECPVRNKPGCSDRHRLMGRAFRLLPPWNAKFSPPANKRSGLKSAFLSKLSKNRLFHDRRGDGPQFRGRGAIPKRNSSKTSSGFDEDDSSDRRNKRMRSIESSGGSSERSFEGENVEEVDFSESSSDEEMPQNEIASSRKVRRSLSPDRAKEERSLKRDSVDGARERRLARRKTSPSVARRDGSRTVKSDSDLPSARNDESSDSDTTVVETGNRKSVGSQTNSKLEEEETDSSLSSSSGNSDSDERKEDDSPIPEDRVPRFDGLSETASNARNSKSNFRQTPKEPSNRVRALVDAFEVTDKKLREGSTDRKYCRNSNVEQFSGKSPDRNARWRNSVTTTVSVVKRKKCCSLKKRGFLTLKSLFCLVCFSLIPAFIFAYY